MELHNIRASHVLLQMDLLVKLLPIGMHVLHALLLDYPHSHQLILPLPEQNLQTVGTKIQHIMMCICQVCR